MRNITEIIINKVALGVLSPPDANYGETIFPESELNLTEEVHSFFEKHILKAVSREDLHPAIFKDKGRNPVMDLIYEMLTNPDVFMANSNKIAKTFYRTMVSCMDTNPGNIAIVQFEDQRGHYIAIIKLDFKNTYGACKSGISVNKYGLPSPSNKVSKIALIKKPDINAGYDLYYADNKYLSYFTEAFLYSDRVSDIRETTNALISTSESFARKAFRDNAAEAVEFRNKINEYVQNNKEVDLSKLHIENPTVKKEFTACLQNSGLSGTIKVDQEWAAKKLNRKRLQVDRSIDLYISDAAYLDPEKFEVKRNGDGSVNLVIKNVRNYIVK